MDLENLVEKITREVMDSLKEKESSGGINSPSYKSSAKAFSPADSPSAGGTAILLCGSSMIDPSVIRSAVSFLRKKNFDVTVAVDPGVPPITTDGIKVVRCSFTNDCSVVARGASTVVILLPDIATISRLANLISDRFDIESTISALEAGKQVWGLNTLGSLSGKLMDKVNGFLREIEGFGITVTRGDGVSSVASPSLSFSTKSQPEPTPQYCSLMTNGDCAGCGLCSQFIGDQVKTVVNQGADRVSASLGVQSIDRNVAGMIDHTLLKADATREQIIKLCEEAKQYGFASCCINPGYVALVSECLKGSPVKTCTVIGFPLGATTSMVKAIETRDAIADGADEIDMVINVGALKAGDHDLVRRDIEAVVNASGGKIVKVIIEAALLTDDEKIKACQLVKQAGADFVKTSTGFGPGGATAHDVALMRQTVGRYMGVKASGGIRDYAKAQEMIKAGATRIGASASVVIAKGDKAKAGSGY